MLKKNKQKKVKKIYRLVTMDADSLKEKYSLLLTKLNSFAYGGLLFIIIATITTLLLIFTPLHNLLPQANNIRLQATVANNKLLIDSLKKEIEIRDNYFTNIKDIITNKNINKFEADTTSTNILTKKEQDSINKVVLEHLNTLETNLNSETYQINKENFITPIQNAVVTNEFNTTKEHYGIDLAAPKNTVILSAQKGTVILASWTMNEGYVIEIQHSNNLITVYKHCGELLKKEGDKVDAAEPIAIVGNTGENTTGYHLHFEIWENGIPINPRKYINF